MKIYDKGPGDKTVIMAVREGLVQPFDAGQWLDLRIGFLLSVCGGVDPTDDNRINGSPTLAESIASVNAYNPQDRVWIGVRNSGTAFPGSTGVVFLGYANTPIATSDSHSSELISSDAGGGSGSDYWRPTRKKDGSTEHGAYVVASDGAATRSLSPSVMHLVQDYTGGHAPGYATMILFRLTRPDNSIGSPITFTTFQGASTVLGFSIDYLFTSTPTKALLQSNLESFTGTVTTLGPFTMSIVPDSLFLYWPFTVSRLRIHCMGVATIS